MHLSRCATPTIRAALCVNQLSDLTGPDSVPAVIVRVCEQQRSLATEEVQRQTVLRTMPTGACRAANVSHPSLREDPLFQIWFLEVHSHSGARVGRC